MGKCAIMQFPPLDLTTSVSILCHYGSVDVKSARNYFKKAPLWATSVFSVSQTTPFASSKGNKENCPIVYFFVSPDLSTSDHILHPDFTPFIFMGILLSSLIEKALNNCVVSSFTLSSFKPLCKTNENHCKCTQMCRTLSCPRATSCHGLQLSCSPTVRHTRQLPPYLQPCTRACVTLTWVRLFTMQLRAVKVGEITSKSRESG